MTAYRNIAAFVLFFIVLLTNIEAQEKKDGNFLKKMYLRVGFELSSFNNSNRYSSLTENGNFMASVAYDYSPHWQFDIMYGYKGDLTRNINIILQNSRTENYIYEHFDHFNSHAINLKGNYFFSKKKEENPFYVTGGISAAVQPVSEVESVNYWSYDTVSQLYNSYSNFNIANSYNRIILGPLAGVGMFLAFGRINFQSEFTYTARFSPFRDKGYRELSFNFTNGLVYKF